MSCLAERTKTMPHIDEPKEGKTMNYHYVAASAPGFVQQLAVAYIARGY